MLKYFFVLIASVCLAACTKPTEQQHSAFSIAIHGGAGAMPLGSYTPEQEAAYTATLDLAIKTGYAMLQAGDSAVDVVEAVIKILEDSPLFNAGKGSVINYSGRIKMDAAIMDGRTLDAGAVNNVRRIKNPISAAKYAMQNQKWILLSGSGAERMARNGGLEMVDPSYFYTQHQYDRWIKTKDSTETEYIHYADSMMALQGTAGYADPGFEKKYGTVGCVVKDKYGNLAAGTSTGGLINKKYNRIGDSPIIGAGTYANNATCAISCTGTGEDFMRMVAAKRVSDLMELKGMSLEEAIHTVIDTEFAAIQGEGGMIAVDKYGNICTHFNTDGMFRATGDDQGNLHSYIYKETGGTE